MTAFENSGSLTYSLEQQFKKLNYEDVNFKSRLYILRHVLRRKIYYLIVISLFNSCVNLEMPNKMQHTTC